MQHILITGANRGIGLAMVKNYLERGDAHVFATARNPASADDLNTLAADHPVTLIQLDINNPESIAASVEIVKQHTDKLDVLINNAGIFPSESRGQTVGELSAAEVGFVVTTNSVSPLMVTQAYVELLKKSDNARVVMISSQMGSIERQANRNGSYAYCMSKAAMNMAARVLASDLRPHGIKVVTTHPGWVQTDMGGSNAALTPAQSAAGLIKIADELTLDQSGQFFNYDGTHMPW